jgi:hypothetical protein
MNHNLRPGDMCETYVHIKIFPTLSEGRWVINKKPMTVFVVEVSKLYPMLTVVWSGGIGYVHYDDVERLA